jgi:Hypothetical protein (DUF2513)
MKRDMDLVRAILLDIEANAPAQGGLNRPVSVDGYDRATITAHVELMIRDAHLIHGEMKKFNTGDDTMIRGLTWRGHEFIAAASSDTIWSKAKSSILKHGSSVSFDLLLEWLKAEGRKHLGLP